MIKEISRNAEEMKEVVESAHKNVGSKSHLAAGRFSSFFNRREKISLEPARSRYNTRTYERLSSDSKHQNLSIYAHEDNEIPSKEYFRRILSLVTSEI